MKEESEKVTKIPNKRGRKAKIVDFTQSKNKIEEVNIIETYILHLPIQIKDINQFSNKNIENILEQVPIVPLPYNTISPIYKNNENIDTNNSNTINDNSTFNFTKKEYKDIDKDISIYNINLLPTDSLTNQILPQKTNIACWWCCHTFDNLPISSPTNYNSKTECFTGVGCFCSFNCVKAYIFDTSYNTRYNKSFLEVFLRKKLINNFDNIKKAPYKTILKMFGGPISIEEYRESFHTMTEYNYSIYPMIFVPCELQEFKFNEVKKIIRNSNSTNITNKKVNVPDRLLSNNSIKNASNRVNITKQDRLQRVSNNLTKIMGIKLL